MWSRDHAAAAPAGRRLLSILAALLCATAAVGGCFAGDAPDADPHPTPSTGARSPSWKSSPRGPSRSPPAACGSPSWLPCPTPRCGCPRSASTNGPAPTNGPQQRSARRSTRSTTAPPASALPPRSPPWHSTNPDLLEAAVTAAGTRLDHRRRALLALRTDALERDPGPADERCTDAADQLATGDIAFNVTATGVLADQHGCPGGQLVQRWCDTATVDVGTADQPLDLVALDPAPTTQLAACAHELLVTTLESTDGTLPDSQVLQLVAPLAWTALLGGHHAPASAHDATLLSEAERVVADEGRSTFPTDTAQVTFDDWLIARSLAGLGLLEVDPDAFELVGSSPEALKRHPLVSVVPADCDHVTLQHIDVDAVTAGSPLEVSTAAIFDSLQQCQVPVTDAPADPVAAEFMALAVAVVGCHNAGRPGELRASPTQGDIPEEFAQDRLLRFISTVTKAPDEAKCVILQPS